MCSYLSFWHKVGHKGSSNIASIVFLYKANGGIDNEQKENSDKVMVVYAQFLHEECWVAKR
jgi:hypothetical protein